MSLPCPVPILFSKGRPFEQALAQALISQDQGVATELQGRLADIRPPTGDTDLSVVAWQGACFVYCASNRIPVKLLHKNPRSTEGGVDIQEAAFAVSLATGVLLERVRQERALLARETRAERTGYVCGRPPYGYRIEGGEFAIDPQQRNAVLFIFEKVREGLPWVDLIRALSSKFSDHGPIKGRPQYWDRVKLRRILEHARLYCLGEYTGGRVKAPVTIPSLAFLPASWIDTQSKSRPPARKASPCP